MSVFGDFDNDGWLDLVSPIVAANRGLTPVAGVVHNRRDGTFEPRRTTFSGLDGIAITAEAVDVNNDGLLDLIFAADPDNSGTPVSLEQYESQVT